MSHQGAAYSYTEGHLAKRWERLESSLRATRKAVCSSMEQNPSGRALFSNSHQGTIWTSSSHGAVITMGPYNFPLTMNRFPYNYPLILSFLRTEAETDLPLCLQSQHGAEELSAKDS